MKKTNHPNLVLVAFSGGLDSTYMVHKLLSEGRDVCPIYFELKYVNLGKSFTEKQQAAKIVSMFREEFPTRISELSTITLKAGFHTQWEIWLDGIKNSISHNPLISEVALGWNQSDLDTEEDVEEFKKRIAIYVKELRGTMKATFPIFHLNKIEIADLLSARYKEEIFCCEIPLYEKNKSGKWTSHSCGKCNSCTLQKMLGIYNPTTYNLLVQPSTIDANEHNKEHNYTLLMMTHHYTKGVKPLHMQKKELVLV